MKTILITAIGASVSKSQHSRHNPLISQYSRFSRFNFSASSTSCTTSTSSPVDRPLISYGLQKFPTILRMFPVSAISPKTRVIPRIPLNSTSRVPAPIFPRLRPAHLGDITAQHPLVERDCRSRCSREAAHFIRCSGLRDSLPFSSRLHLIRAIRLICGQFSFATLGPNSCSFESVRGFPSSLNYCNAQL